MPQSTSVFADGLGRRELRLAAADAPPTEHLVLNSVLAGHEGFMAALTERFTQLQGRRFTSYARAQALDAAAAGGPEVVSEYVRGWRLADLLDVAESENLTFDIGVVMLLLRQLLPTASLLSTLGRDTASGALGPEHLLLTPQGRLVLTDYLFGPAVEALHWSPEALWRTLRVATPPNAKKAVSQRGDVVQVGVTVLSLVVGRRLRDDEFPERLDGLVASARQKTPNVIDAPLSPGLRDWLLSALQIAPKPFEKLFDAQMALERLLTSDAALLAQPAELDQAVSRFERFMPAVELPEPPAELPLLEAPPPDLVPMAVAFDRPAAKPAPAPAVEAEPEADPEPEVQEVQEVVARVVDEPAPPRTSKHKSGVRKGKAARAVAAPPVEDVDEPLDVAEDEPIAAAPAPAAAANVAPAFTEDAETSPAPAFDEVDTQVPPPVPPRERPQRPAPAAPTFGMRDVTPEPEPSYEPAYAVAQEETPWWRSTKAVAALVVVSLLQTATLVWMARRPGESLGGDGEIVVTSRPEGAQVVIDDREYGVTPATVRLSPGTHVLQVRAGSTEPRIIPLSIRAGTQTAQYVELMGVATTGVLEVRSEPARAKVTIDGRERGSTPLTLRDVTPGDYQVVLERAGWKSTQTVRVEPGSTAQLVVPIPRAPEPPKPVEPPPSADAPPPPAAEPPKTQ